MGYARVCVCGVCVCGVHVFVCMRSAYVCVCAMCMYSSVSRDGTAACAVFLSVCCSVLQCAEAQKVEKMLKSDMSEVQAMEHTHTHTAYTHTHTHAHRTHTSTCTPHCTHKHMRCRQSSANLCTCQNMKESYTACD